MVNLARRLQALHDKWDFVNVIVLMGIDDGEAEAAPLG
jgi:hypothetical protein